MVKCKALETALNDKILSSHEHLKKVVFSPPPPVHLKALLVSIGIEDRTGVDYNMILRLRLGFIFNTNRSKMK